MIGRLERREDAGSKAYHRASVGIACGERQYKYSPVECASREAIEYVALDHQLLCHKDAFIMRFVALHNIVQCCLEAFAE